MAKIFVGNLDFDARDEDLRAAFSEHGVVSGADVPLQAYSRQSSGYGFIDMPDPAEARSAAEAMNGLALNGSQLVVRVVIP